MSCPYLENRSLFDLGSHTLEVIHTPGHTSGSICLYEFTTKVLFSGGLNKQWLTHVEPYNEPNCENPDQVKWMIYSGQVAMDLCESWGYKAGLFGFSSGCPSVEQMKLLLPVLDDMAKRGHILTMHDGPLSDPMSFRKQAPWGCLRFTKWYEFAMEAGHPDSRCGLDRGVRLRQAKRRLLGRPGMVLLRDGKVDEVQGQPERDPARCRILHDGRWWGLWQPCR